MKLGFIASNDLAAWKRMPDSPQNTALSGSSSTLGGFCRSDGRYRRTDEEILDRHHGLLIQGLWGWNHTAPDAEGERSARDLDQAIEFTKTLSAVCSSPAT